MRRHVILCLGTTGRAVMTPTMKSLGIDRLSVADRLTLLEEIWDSIAATAEDVPLTEAQKEELDRRLAAHQADPQARSPWEEVKARLLGPRSTVRALLTPR